MPVSRIAPLFFPPVLLALLLLFPFAPPVVAAGKISSYQHSFSPCRDERGTLQLAIRRFVQDGIPRLLLVNPLTLETSIVAAADVGTTSVQETASLGQLPYVRALERFSDQPNLQNAGLTHGDSPREGLFLTVDLCPSRRPFERELFVVLGEIAGKSGEAAPVAIAISGHWLGKHPEETAWLKGEAASGRLAITWVNHSYSHPYDPARPYRFNFLLSVGVDFEAEVLATEKLLIENGLIPSAFFRFPGLVSDRALLKKLRQLSLIPLGSDAWLAKGETAANGSIVLVHGNGNEPQGIKKLLPLLRGENPPKLLPLRKAVAGVH